MRALTTIYTFGPPSSLFKKVIHFDQISGLNVFRTGKIRSYFTESTWGLMSNFVCISDMWLWLDTLQKNLANHSQENFCIQIGTTRALLLSSCARKSTATCSYFFILSHRFYINVFSSKVPVFGNGMDWRHELFSNSLGFDMSAYQNTGMSR